jgi:hypothetical protein
MATTAATDMDKIIDNLPQSPEKARDSVVKALLIDKNMKCKGCDRVYKTAGDMEQLSIYKYRNINDPATMTVFLECKSHEKLQGGLPIGYCGHVGTHTFRPNPFIMSRQGAF